MVCYVIPASSAVLLFLARKRGLKDSHSLGLLNLMLGGGAVMLIIDHIWNNELLLIGENIASDLLLGVLMTAGTILFWGLLAATKRISSPEISRTKV